MDKTNLEEIIKNYEELIRLSEENTQLCGKMLEKLEEIEVKSRGIK